MTTDIIKYVDRISLEELQEFVAHYAEINSEFEQALAMRFSHYLEGSSKKVYQQVIRSVVRRSKRRYGYIGRAESRSVGKVGHELVTYARKALEEELFRIAFEIATVVVEEMHKCVEHADDSDGEIHFNIPMALEVINLIVVNDIDDKLRKDIVKYTRAKFKKETFEGWDWDFDLVHATIPALRTKREAQSYVDILEGRTMSKYDFDRSTILLAELLPLAESPEYAEDFIRQNIHIPELRKKCIFQAHENNDLAYARQLVAEAIIIDEKSGHRWQWIEMLLEIEIAEENIVTAISISKSLYLDTWAQNNDRYLQIMKSNLSQKEWDVLVDELIDTMWEGVPPQNPRLMQLLVSEERWSKFLEAMQGASLYRIQHYEQILIDRFPEGLGELYHVAVTEWGDRASSRKHYQSVASYLKRMASLGYKNRALEIIEYLLVKNTRRPAMKEELMKAFDKIVGD